MTGQTVKSFSNSSRNLTSAYGKVIGFRVGDVVARQGQTDMEGGEVELNQECMVSIDNNGCGLTTNCLVKERCENCNVCRFLECKMLSCVHDNPEPWCAEAVTRAVHDYEYIQIQFDYYGMIMITIQLRCIHSSAKYI